MELDLQSLIGLHVHCTAVLIGWDLATPPPHLGSYTRALLVSQDRRHLFVIPPSSALQKLTARLFWIFWWYVPHSYGQRPMMHHYMTCAYDGFFASFDVSETRSKTCKRIRRCAPFIESCSWRVGFQFRGCLPQRRCLPPFGSGGHTRLRERGCEVPIRTRGQTLWYSRYICILCGTNHREKYVSSLDVYKTERIKY